MAATEPGTQQVLIELRSRADGAWLADPELGRRLVALAEEDGSNRNEVALRILARRYGTRFVPNGRKAKADPEVAAFTLHLPLDLYTLIAGSAGAARRSAAAEIRAALSAHFGLRVPAPPKRTRAPRRRPVVAK